MGSLGIYDRRRQWLRSIASGGDILVVAFAFLAAHALLPRVYPLLTGQEAVLGPVSAYLWILTVLLPLVPFLNGYFGLYVLRVGSTARLLLQVGKAVATLAVLGGASLFLLHDHRFSRLLLVLFTVLIFAALATVRLVVVAAARQVRAKGMLRRRVVVAGSAADVARWAPVVGAAQEMDLAGVITPAQTNGAPAANGNIATSRAAAATDRRLGDLRDVEGLLSHQPIDEIILASPLAVLPNAMAFLGACEAAGVRVRLLPDSEILRFRDRTRVYKLGSERLAEIPTLTLSATSEDLEKLVLKRLIDIIAAAMLIVILSPLFVLIAILVKLTSPGTVFYPWRVIGRGNRSFTGYKFRTMVANADDLKAALLVRNEMHGPVFKMRNDPRVTAVGRALRKFSLDELPQLWSVLKGDMSLVGPRPPAASELERFEFWQRRKLTVKPGITCLWQVNGRHAIADFSEWARLDLEYIDNWSLWLDIKILFRTIPAVVRGTGV
jgi:exopolysaccharide biosynthesis polyprenyl glycosylphosphotransferase